MIVNPRVDVKVKPLISGLCRRGDFDGIVEMQTSFFGGFLWRKIEVRRKSPFFLINFRKAATSCLL